MAAPWPARVGATSGGAVEQLVRGTPAVSAPSGRRLSVSLRRAAEVSERMTLRGSIRSARGGRRLVARTIVARCSVARRALDRLLVDGHRGDAAPHRAQQQLRDVDDLHLPPGPPPPPPRGPRPPASWR